MANFKLAAHSCLKNRAFINIYLNLYSSERQADKEIRLEVCYCFIAAVIRNTI